MNVIVHTRTHYDGCEAKHNMTYVSLDELLEKADIVSLHTPNTPQTKGMVDKAFLEKMKPTAMLINTSRGTVVNDDDLLAHLESHKTFWVGTDVFNGEPATGKADWSNAMAQHPRVYGTHHCGASTAQAESAIGEEALRVIKKFAKTGEIDSANCVNRAKPDGKLQTLSVRHKDKIGVLNNVFEVIAMHKLNVQELQNLVF